MIHWSLTVCLLVSGAMFLGPTALRAQLVYELPASIEKSKSDIKQIIEKPIITLYTQIQEPERKRVSYYDTKLTKLYHKGKPLSNENFPFRTTVGKYESVTFRCKSPTTSAEIHATMIAYLLDDYDFFFVEMKAVPEKFAREFLDFDLNPNPVSRFYYKLIDKTSLGAEYIYSDLDWAVLLRNPTYFGERKDVRATPYNTPSAIVMGQAIPPEQLPSSWGANAAPSYLQTVMLFGEFSPFRIKYQRHTSEEINIVNEVTFLPLTHMEHVADTIDKIPTESRKICNSTNLDRVAEPLPFPNYEAFFGPPN